MFSVKLRMKNKDKYNTTKQTITDLLLHTVVEKNGFDHGSMKQAVLN